MTNYGKFDYKLDEVSKRKLEEWLDRLEQPRAGSLFDNHTELGMMYVLRRLLGKDVVDLEKKATKWQKQMFSRWKKELREIKELGAKKDE